MLWYRWNATLYLNAQASDKIHLLYRVTIVLLVSFISKTATMLPVSKYFLS